MSFNSQRRLSGVDFDAAANQLASRLGAERLSAARSAMVDGEKFEDIALAKGWKTRNSVSVIVRKVWDAHLELKRVQRVPGGEAYPPGWHKVTLVAPDSLIDKWSKELRDLVASISAPPVLTDLEPAAVQPQPARKAPSAKKAAAKPAPVKKAAPAKKPATALPVAKKSAAKRKH